MAIFSGKQKNDTSQAEVPTLISKGCVVEGCIRATALVRIDGNIKGNLFTEGLIIGENGFVQGDIETKEIIVFGTIHGNINADSIEIKNCGKIYGEIHTRNLEIEKGAVFNGVLSMEPVKMEAVKRDPFKIDPVKQIGHIA